MGIWPRSKRDLPAPPQRIVLITSKQSAALADFRNTYYQEGGKAPIEVLDVLLQGEQAPRMIANAITRANTDQLGDVIVLMRGGGRTVDLSVFDDIWIAEAICRSNLPIITGIGHQQDTSIADRLADQAAITPTAAAHHLARLSVPNSSTTTPNAHPYPRNASQLMQGLIVALGATIVVLLTVLLIAILLNPRL